MVIYAADDTNEHCIGQVEAGVRHTLAMWFTRDPSHDEDSKLIPALAAALARIQPSLCAPGPGEGVSEATTRSTGPCGALLPVDRDQRPRARSVEAVAHSPTAASLDTGAKEGDRGGLRLCLPGPWARLEVPLPREVSASMYTLPAPVEERPCPGTEAVLTVATGNGPSRGDADVSNQAAAREGSSAPSPLPAVRLPTASLAGAPWSCSPPMRQSARELRANADLAGSPAWLPGSADIMSSDIRVAKLAAFGLAVAMETAGWKERVCLWQDRELLPFTFGGLLHALHVAAFLWMRGARMASSSEGEDPVPQVAAAPDLAHVYSGPQSEPEERAQCATGPTGEAVLGTQATRGIPVPPHAPTCHGPQGGVPEITRCHMHGQSSPSGKLGKIGRAELMRGVIEWEEYHYTRWRHLADCLGDFQQTGFLRSLDCPTW